MAPKKKSDFFNRGRGYDPSEFFQSVNSSEPSLIVHNSTTYVSSESPNLPPSPASSDNSITVIRFRPTQNSSPSLIPEVNHGGYLQFYEVESNKHRYIESSPTNINQVPYSPVVPDNHSLPLSPVSPSTEQCLYEDYPNQINQTYRINPSVATIVYPNNLTTIDEQSVRNLNDSPINYPRTSIPSPVTENEQSQHATPDSEYNNSRNTDRDGSFNKKRQQNCRSCANHKKLVPVKGHKWHCEFRNCSCKDCITTQNTRRSMKEQIKNSRKQQNQLNNPDLNSADSRSASSSSSSSGKTLAFPRLAELERETKEILDTKLFEKVNQMCRPKQYS